MAVKLRLARHGAKKRPFYRIVAAPSRTSRDGRFLEQLGQYDPMLEPPGVKLKRERIQYWLDQGAQPSRTVRNLIDRFMDAPDNTLNRSTVRGRERPGETPEQPADEGEEIRQAAQKAAEDPAPEGSTGEASDAGGEHGAGEEEG